MFKDGKCYLKVSVILAAMGLLGGCSSKGQPAGPLASSAETTQSPAVGENPTATPTPPEPMVVWKRARVVERDLMRALALEHGQMCVELGGTACVEAHLAPLGGNEPFERAQYKPIPGPSSTTPIVLERLVMGACAKRVELDSAGEPRVFTQFDLKGAPKIGDAQFESALDAQHRVLFQRLLSRNPSDAELNSLRELLKSSTPPKTGAALATLGCFVIGTHAEFVFL